jgi:hypothetical protein
MAKEIAGSEPLGPAPLFNSTLETGVRAAVVLDALHARTGRSRPPVPIDCDHLLRLIATTFSD